MNDNARRNRMIALIGTVAFHVIVLILLCAGYMEYSAQEPRRWPPADSSEILYGGELVMLGNTQAPSTVNDTPAPPEKAERETPQADDEQDKGTKGDPEPLVAAREESPAKVKEEKKPEKKGPSKEEIAEQERIKREKETAKNINRLTKNAFGNSGAGNGKAGSPNGNSATGAVAGSPGHSLKGRTLESFGRPNSALSGTIRIRVRVNRQGYVVGSPEYVGGEGPAASNMAVRNRCIAASQESRFSVSLDAQAEQVGVITWRFN